MSATAAYGSWSSPIDAASIAAGGLRLGEPRIDRGVVTWLEGRPAEGGRTALMRATPGEPARECSPADANVRTLVHEYGGGAYLAQAGRIFFVAFETQQVHELGVGPLSAPGARHADFALSPDGRWLAAVEERPREGGEPENRIVVFDLEARGARTPRVVSAGSDFVSFPRFAPGADQLVFTRWDHPCMPWDETELCAIAWSPEGPSGAARVLAGGPGESIYQPCFSAAGRLVYASDRSGWWNLIERTARGERLVCPREAEFGSAQWVFATSRYAFIDEDTLLVSYHEAGRDRLARLALASGSLETLAPELTSVGYVEVDAASGRACFLGAAADRAPAVMTLDLASGALETLRSSLASPPPPEWISHPRAISFPSAGGRTAHALYYPPRHPELRGPADERPPLLVKSHGGPTASTSAALDLRTQFWTSRGVALVDVDYGGSTGYGRAYRSLLREQWGIVDVEDCVHAALYLAERGEVDRARLAISGGSAGGYTTLCALTFHDVFGAGASHYGIGDLEALARDTHKFEARYLDGLVGPYPAERERYRERSPIHFTERLSCPVAFFQGLEDKVVPPNQAEAMVAALAARGIPHMYVPFAGEQHGFRRAENITTALEGELWFYAQVFGFEVDVAPPGVELRRPVVVG